MGAEHTGACASAPRPYFGTLKGGERYTAYPTGMVFGLRRRRTVARAFLVPLCVPGGWLMVLLASTSDYHRSGATALVGIGLMVWGALFTPFALRALWIPGGVAVLREGVYVRGAGGRAWVPWHALVAVRVAQRGRGLRQGPLRLALWIRHGHETVRRGSQLLGPLIGNLGNVGYRASAFQVPAFAVADTIVHYWQRYPRARELLSDAAETQRRGAPGRGSRPHKDHEDEAKGHGA